MIRFSVVIPCYNTERWVREAIDSVFAQTHQPHEIIVIDDGSTDRSVEIIQSYGDRVTLLHSQRRNGAGARNVGILQTSGEWIAFLDADDYWYPDHLERGNALLSGTDDVGFINNLDLITAADGRLYRRRSRWPVEKPTCGLSAERYIEMLADNSAFAGMTACILRRDRLMQVGMLDEKQIRRHDLDVWLRVIHEHTWAVDPVSSSVYRGNVEGSISSPRASAEYHHLLAVTKNQHLYPTPAYDRVLRNGARRAIATALTDGRAEEVDRAMQLGKPYLYGRDRITFVAAKMAPMLFRSLNRIRRKFARRKAQRQTIIPES